MIFPGPGNAIVALAAANAALTVTRIASQVTGTAAPSQGEFVSDASVGEWKGVQCCPKCLGPITEKEKWSACCSKCGHTEYAFISTKTRARRKVIGPDGVAIWEYKPDRTGEAGVAICIGAAALVLFSLLVWVTL